MATQLPSMPQAMAYANWMFDVPWLENLTFELEFVSGDEERPGRYFQLNDFKIGNVGTYCGFQTNLMQPRVGWQGKGLLFSRWETQDLGNADALVTGFTECGQHEDLFIGVRNRWQWTLGRYIVSLRQSKPDDSIGRWYELHAKRISDGEESSSGSLRFPYVGGKPPLIESGGGTWLEAYGDIRYAVHDEDVPRTELIVHSVRANDQSLRPHTVRVNYNPPFPAGNVTLYPDGRVSLVGGKGVTRVTAAGNYRIPKPVC